MPVRTYHEEQCASVMREVIQSLLDIYNTYQMFKLIIAELEDTLDQNRATTSPDAASISALEHLVAVGKRNLAARKAHDIAFKAGLRNPAYSDPTALRTFLIEDGKKYKALTTDYNSEAFRILKQSSPETAGRLEASFGGTF